MLDDAADEIEAHLGQTGIAVACEQRRLAVPDRQVGVHTRTIIFLDRLRHEGCGFAIGMGNLMHDIFVDLHTVGGLRQCAEGQAKLMLCGCHFMVVLVAGQAHFEHGRNHLATDVHAAVDRRNGEVTTLGAWAVAHIAGFIFRAAVGRQFDIVDLVVRRVVAVFETHIVEHEEFGFRTNIDGVANACGLQIGFSALCGRTRVTAVEFTGRRFHDVAEDHQHRRCREWIDINRIEVGLQDHVGFVDGLPAFDRRAVEHQAVFQLVFANHARAHGQMLPLALGVGEADIDPLDLFFLDTLDNILGGRAHVAFLL